MRHPAAALLSASLILGSCRPSSSVTGQRAGPPPGAPISSPDWPLFGGNPQRTNASSAATGIGAADLPRLRRQRIPLPGTVDSSPIYVHGIVVSGAAHDLFVATTTYGRTIAVDARSGRILWQFTPVGLGATEGTYRITNATPVADPQRRYVYAASPDGLIHKLRLTDGSEQAGWPVEVTRDSSREKLAGSLTIAGGAVIAVTGGYLGDQPPYQGHVVGIDRRNGRVRAVFNSLCAPRAKLIVPATCPASDSAIWARAGAVVEPGGRRLLVATGNGPYDGRTSFGDSVLELRARDLHLLQAYTPAEQAELEAADTDLGSSAPALLPGRLAVTAGKDGILRLLDLAALDGHRAPRPFRTGGELQRIAAPGGAALYSAPAVSGRTVFVASAGGTAAYALHGRRLQLRWSAPGHGSSPVLAGGLLWVYDVDAGKLDVYEPRTGRLLQGLDAAPGHWNSPVIAGSRVALPEGNANDHSATGLLDLYSVG